MKQAIQAPSGSQAAKTTEDSTAIAKMFDEYAVAWKSSDAARIGNLYAADAVLLPGDHPAVTGVSAIVKYNQEVFDAYTPVSFDITQQETEIAGDWAFTRGVFTFSAASKTGGPPLRDRGKYIVILRRQADESWKWSRDIENSDGMPATSTSTPAPGKTQ